MGSTKVKNQRTALAVVAQEPRAEERRPVEQNAAEASEAPCSDSRASNTAVSGGLAREDRVDGARGVEVADRLHRRQFTAEYKLHVLQEAERCRDAKGIGSLLRREGLYSSHLGKWRQQRERGALSALEPR